MEMNEMMDKPSYKPIYLIFTYLLVVCLVIALPIFSIGGFISNFMAGFFLIFSFFKLLDLKGFAEGYARYDLIAKRFLIYGYIYPFLELAFGLGYLLLRNNYYLNVVVFIVMFISTLGVCKSLYFDKQKINCACVGTFLNVPLGSVALIEDFTMALMALLMLFIW